MTSKKSTSPEVGHQAVLRFPYQSTSRARTVAESVGRESGRIPGGRTTATVERDGDTVRISLEADDLAALRAGTFTWCSLIQVAGETARRIEE